MNQQVCPDPESLRHLLSGELPAETAESLEEHFAGCDLCLAAAAKLTEGDVLAADVRRAAALRGSHTGARRTSDRLIQRIVSATQTASVACDGTSSGRDAKVTDMGQIKSLLFPAQTADEIGRLGGFRVLDVIGSGGMGVVLRSEDLTLERPVALKVMKPAVTADPTFRERFLREAQSAATVRNDHIVTIYQAGEDNGVLFLAMELLDGESLQERLDREGSLSVSEATRIACETALGLAAAHAQGVLHRDIKPANIWLERESGRVKILDFGLAQSMGPEGRLTQSGLIVGTPRFMSPEQADGMPVDQRSDLFSLGSVLYCMLTGQAPFDRTSALATLNAIAAQPHQRVSEVNQDVPSRLSDIVNSLLAKDPEDRPKSATVLIRSLGWSRHLSTLPQSSGTSARVRLLAVVVAAVTLLTMLVFTLQTRHGTLQVQMDETIAVSLHGENVEVRDTTTGAVYSIRPGRNSLDPGEYQLVVSEAQTGLEFSTRRFVIRRWAEQALVVTLKPDDPPRMATSTMDHKAASKLQQDWARYLERDVEWTHAGTGLRFVLIPPGEFQMGTHDNFLSQLIERAEESPTGKEMFLQWLPLESPQHKVVITQPFYLGRFEVTQGQWSTIMRNNPTGDSGDPDHPVERISWNDIQTFLAKLNAQPESGMTFMLPTEAQWEYACRAGTTTLFNSGDSEESLSTVAYFSENSNGAYRPVGDLLPNAWGLYDMHGNVSEWCLDRCGSNYYGHSPLKDPTDSSPDTKVRTVRGGDYTAVAMGCRSAFRYARMPDDRMEYVGFRLAAALKVNARKSSEPTR